MPSSSSSLILLSRIKDPKNTNFKDYYKKWLHTLKNTLLPLLHQSLSTPTTTPNLLSSHLYLFLHHLLSYYDSLDLAATANPNYLPHLLYPSWRNSLEKPFLFLGDLHPYVFTNLVRSFIDRENNDDDGDDDDIENGKKGVILGRSWHVVMAWKDPSEALVIKIGQIERGLRLMVPSFMDRMKRAQAKFVGRVVEDWVNCGGNKERIDVGEAIKAEMEELLGVFVDANRLRSSIISDIVGALDVYQGALFLEGLAQFLIGFQDPHLLHKFEKSKIPIRE